MAKKEAEEIEEPTLEDLEEEDIEEVEAPAEEEEKEEVETESLEARVETEKKSVDDADEAEGSFMSVDAAEKRNVKKSDLKLDEIADDMEDYIFGPPSPLQIDTERTPPRDESELPISDDLSNDTRAANTRGIDGDSVDCYICLESMSRDSGFRTECCPRIYHPLCLLMVLVILFAHKAATCGNRL